MPKNVRVIAFLLALSLPGVVHARTAQVPASPAALYPSIPDGSGGQYRFFSDRRDGSDDVYLLRVTSSGATAPGWPEDGAIVCNAPGDQFGSQIVPDGQGGAIVIWYDRRDNPKFDDVYAQRIDASGTRLWPLTGVKLIDDPWVWNELVATPDGTGGLLVAWVSSTSSHDILALRIGSTGAVAPGWNPNGQVVCSAVDAQHGPAIAADGLGGAYLSWLDRRSGLPRLYAQRVSADGVAQWTSNGIQLDDGSDPVGSTSIVPESGDAMVFWGSSLSVRGQRLDPTGIQKWQAGGAIQSIYSSSSLSLIAISDGAGGAILGWDAANRDLRAQRVDGNGAPQWGNFDHGVVLRIVPLEDTYNLDLCTDGAGGAYFAWEDGRADSWDIYTQHVTAAGTIAWTTNGVPVTSSFTQEASPATVPDGAGGVVVTFSDLRNPEPGVYTQRYDPSGSAQLPDGGALTYTDRGTQRAPKILHTSDGGVLSVWAEKRGGSYDLRARKFDDSGVPGTASIVCDLAGDQFPTAIIDDGAGGAIVAWADGPGFLQPTIRVQRIDGNAVPQWTANGVVAAVTPGLLLDPLAVTPDGSGGIILAWVDYVHSNIKYPYAQRVSSAGVVQWTTNGVLLSSGTGYKADPQVVTDGAGGAILAWLETRNNIPTRVFAQRLDAAGNAQWTPNGIPIVAGHPIAMVSSNDHGAVILYAPSGGSAARLAAQRIDGAGASQWGVSVVNVGTATIDAARLVDDGAGGVFVAWSDTRNQTRDIFGQHLNAAGDATWTTQGKALCDAASYQELGDITRVGSDLVLTWADFRSGDADLYAHRVDIAGNDVWTADGVLVGQAPRGQYAAAISPYRASGTERFYVGWVDNRLGNDRLVHLQQLNSAGAPQWADGTTDVAVSLVSADIEAGAVHITWMTGASLPATVYRRTGSDALWTSLGRVTADGTGRVAFEDRDITPGTSYGYRLGVIGDDDEVFSSEIRIDVPVAAAFALERVVASGAGRATVSFAVPHAGPATLEWVDVGGRRVGVHELDLPAGRHTLDIESPVASGVYFLRLMQAERSAVRRVAQVR